MKKETIKMVRDLAKQVKRIERCYTGGGIYIYKIELKNGKFLHGATLSETIYVDTNLFELEDDDVLYDGYTWFEEHSLGTVDVEYDDFWDADDIWNELEKKYKPTWDGYDGYGERIITK